MSTTSTASTISRSTAPSAASPSGGTVDAGEIARFSAIAAEWWDPRGKFKPLHKYNPIRIAYIRDAVCARFGRDPNGPLPLKGLRFVDIGCGGGLLAEPLARLGAEMVGIDAAGRNVAVAALHAEQSGVDVDYRHTTAEDLAASGERFDVVLALEVVEHVAHVPLFLQSLTTLMNPGSEPGAMLFLATINRTPKAFALAIVGAEYVLRWLPRGTHDWRKFLKPSELAAGFRPHGVTVRDITGVVYNPLRDEFSLNRRDLDTNYMLWAAGTE
ncbi:3-demethylubiquinone-9 3-methyltransferase [Skermanella stibiiresistens SB22]|uniref:Ubiquinone biosynthesis O-methyltransferase n=1 Tax=Skermanella stibiiresistens SB22 TaxID=1385369 RepID=W9H4H4_9PROT|nr:bifunctional 2-polyprenyl-6-hydroxyphenol methylase/3-demethylubiquinol 3-O-methyltransferase UbiG [Skermanella stibiiresistens]EWY40969.1 3-demethylubiquinone-9 3-methyltransferase [Skermanella stibiiresistens SB22]